jgi:hypothetical protein
LSFSVSSTTTNATFYPVFVSGTGVVTPSIRTTASALRFNASSSSLAAGVLESDGDIYAGRSIGVGMGPSGTTGRIDAAGDIIAFSTSDIRLKQDITPIENSLEKLSTISGVNYKWKPEFNDIHGYNDKHDVGVIAQDVLSILPEAVRQNSTGYYSVRYERIIPLLIEAIKEQQKQIDELKSKLK